MERFCVCVWVEYEVVMECEAWVEVLGLVWVVLEHVVMLTGHLMEYN